MRDTMACANHAMEGFSATHLAKPSDNPLVVFHDPQTVFLQFPLSGDSLPISIVQFSNRSVHMSTIRVKDGTEICYKDWGSGQPIVFSHGWPLTGDDWDAQMLFFGQRGYRVIAHDRRGQAAPARRGRATR
jgi:hypothetical protein